ncbi:MAG: AmmeMemoRadiSam system protein B [Defluviitaleaceae bacterium]|nr:AmmeMemoRadiSam system protein B [Defluviitaleaceae bacterium]
MKTMLKGLAAAMLLLVLFASNSAVVNYGSVGQPQEEATATAAAITEPMLAIRNITHEIFNHSVANPRPYEVDGFIAAGVVPHHTTAAVLISGFFTQAAAFADYYDLVIILAPNHEGDLANVVLSYRDWDIGQGVFAHRGFVSDLMAAPDINTAISHDHLEIDHSASVLIPYVYHYLPGTKVAPILLNRSLSFNDTTNLFHWLMDWIDASGQNVLLVASIDFSHFLTAPEAMERDIFTANAIANRDYRLLHSLCDHYLDSPAAMVIFLKYLGALGIEAQIAYHTDATEFLGPGLDETTSYKIIVGAKPPYPAQPTQVRLTFTGDLMLHEPQMSIDFDHTFSRVRPHLESADLTIGNLETVLNGTFSDFPLFSAPDDFGHALKNAGFDLLATANNHSLDQGVDGLLRSLDFLDSIGIDTFGTYRNREERDDVLIREVEGIRFAFLAYTFGTNGQPIPQGRDYLVNLMNDGLIAADIARARELADFVIVMPHMGNEYEQTVRQEFKDWAMMMLEAGADIVVASHPHVVQPMGFVQIIDIETNTARRGFVAYCLGNFVSSQRIVPRETGVMLNLYFETNGTAPPTFTAASYVPTWVKFANAAGQRDIIVLPIAETLQAIEAGENLNLRQADIIRMRDAHRELSEIILGHSIAFGDMRGEYFIP